MGTFPDIDVLPAAIKAKTAPAISSCPKSQLQTYNNSMLQNYLTSG
jgi:hypothetical protein